MEATGLSVAWGALTFAAPAVAWGAAACSIPVLIHLVLRQRARRHVFPALRFLLVSHQQSTRAHRLKHLLLLACRMLIIVLLLLLLARATYHPSGDRNALAAFRPSGEPVAAVICVDTSASMGYRFQGRSRVQAAAEWASAILADEQRLPPGSQFAIVAGNDRQSRNWLADRKAGARLLGVARQGDHADDVASLLVAAWQTLESAPHQRKEVYLFTDMTTESWRKAAPSLPEQLQALYVLDVGQDEHHSAALVSPEIPGHTLPAERSSSLTLRIRSGDTGLEPVIELRVDGVARGHQKVPALAARSEREVQLAVPALSRGMHALEIAMEPSDAFHADNTRYLVVAAGELPRVLLVRNGPDNQVATLLGAMIAPPAQPEQERTLLIDEFTGMTLDRERLAGATACILADVGLLDAASWRALQEYIRGGGFLLVVPGPNISATNYEAGAALLPASVLGVAETPDGLSIAAATLDHRWLRPFMDPALDSINDRRAFRHLKVGPLRPDSTVLAPFSDGTPAILLRRIGSGEVALWAFSPAAEWGQFGTQAAPLIVLLHTMLEGLRPPPQGVAAHTAGQIAFFNTSDSGAATVYLADESGQAARAVPLTAGRMQLPTHNAGVYRVLSDPGGVASPLLHYAVNVAQAESDPARITEDQFRSALADKRAVLARSPDALATFGEPGVARVDLTVPIGLALLTLLLVESAFSNRFYNVLGRVRGPG